MARLLRQAEALRLDLPGRSAIEVVSAATGARAATFRLVEIAPGPADRGPHIHDGFEEVIFVLAGHGEIRTPSGALPLVPGDTVLVPPNEPHASFNTGSEPLRLACFFAVSDIRPGTAELTGWDNG